MAVTIKKVEKWAQKKKINKLINALPAVDTDVRAAIIKALGTTKDEKAMYTITTYLRDPDVSIRFASVEALGNMGIGRALEFVRQMWNIETDAETREKAEWAIHEIKAKMTNEDRSK